MRLGAAQAQQCAGASQENVATSRPVSKRFREPLVERLPAFRLRHGFEWDKKPLAQKL
jgi:hypothetical protein